MKTRYLSIFSLAFLALSLTGCPKKTQLKTDEPVPEDAAKPEEEPSLRGKDYKDVEGIGSIYFELDQTSLRADARETLNKNYQVIKGHSDWEILVEGHADERGTTEYNLGLGQKRAAAVRSYYMSLGMRGGKIATISYGKESPLCNDQNDDCWSKNRRGVTKIKISEKK